MKRIWLMTLMLSLLLVTTLSVGTALAQGEDPPQKVAALRDLTFFTRYPAQEMAIGENVTFDFTLRTQALPQTVRLEVQNLPDQWVATFKGGGRIIESAYVEPENDTKIDLRVDPPKDVAPGAYTFTVIARGENGQDAKMPIELTVKEKLPPSMEFTVELPTLRGAPDTTFRYNATLKNEGDEDLAVNLLAEAPPGFRVDFKLSGQDVTSIPLAANESKRLSVEVKMFPEIPAGSYPVKILAQGGEVQAGTSLTAEVTGEVVLSVTAPDGRLSGQAYVGQTTPQKLVIQNTGSAPAHNVELSASSPAGWEVKFDPPALTEIGAGQAAEVTAQLTPADQAIAGDYMVTVRAKPEDGATESADFRITVLTSTLWGIAGVGLIAVAVLVVGLAVVRFGRR